MISVVMSVFNGAAFLQESIGSVLNQSFREFEFIIVDDGSTDGSAEIIASFASSDSRIVSIRQENRGLAAARPGADVGRDESDHARALSPLRSRANRDRVRLVERAEIR